MIQPSPFTCWCVKRTVGKRSEAMPSLGFVSKSFYVGLVLLRSSTILCPANAASPSPVVAGRFDDWFDSAMKAQRTPPPPACTPPPSMPRNVNGENSRKNNSSTSATSAPSSSTKRNRVAGTPAAVVAKQGASRRRRLGRIIIDFGRHGTTRERNDAIRMIPREEDGGRLAVFRGQQTTPNNDGGRDRNSIVLRLSSFFSHKSGRRIKPRSARPDDSQNDIQYSSRNNSKDHYQPRNEIDLAGGGGERIQVSVDPTSLPFLLTVVLSVSSSTLAAFVGTLRLLAPLVVARRVLISIGHFVGDYLRGRYMRYTYTRLERIYIRYYEAPAALRAASRITFQIVTKFFLSGVLSFMIGITHPPCKGGDDLGLASFCGLLWILLSSGLGHLCAKAVAVWGGPLRIQASSPSLLDVAEKESRSFRRVLLTRPWRVLLWMQDPGQWISTMSAPPAVRKPFTPNPLIFPVTWEPLRWLQFCALARVFLTEPCHYSLKWNGASGSISNARIRRLMKQFLVQMSLGDEWCRVVLEEKRVGLGIVVIICYVVAMIVFVASSATMNVRATAFFIPSVVAAIVSAWMNIVIFWNRLEARRKEEALREMSKKRQAVLSALTVKPPLY